MDQRMSTSTEGNIMTRSMRWAVLPCLMVTVGLGLSQAAQAAGGYNPVAQQAQTKLAALGINPGPLDGVAGGGTRTAVLTFQQQSGLPQTGILDPATLDKLGIGTSVDKVNAVADWIPVPTQDDLDKLTAKPINDPSSAYTDYRPNAPAANLDLPGAAILAAMNNSADVYGSRAQGQPGHTDQGYKYLTECLKTNYAPTHWPDIVIHYYCMMSKPRQCYTYALSGKSTGAKIPRPRAYQGCAAGALPNAADFAFVAKTQPLVFQYVMYGQTHAFNHEQEQAVINAFYGVKNPADRNECLRKRPRRTEDPGDGTHCLVNKTMNQRLVGKGE
jgi:peptidoglycan hydrolase-like protein with peptidoglycan-binding domain